MKNRTRRRNIREMRDAIGRDELDLHYQPIVDLRTGETVAAEALCRWNHPTEGLKYPGPWLDTLLGEEMLDEFGSWCWPIVSMQAQEWDDIRISVNVCPQRLLRPDCADWILRVLDNHHVRASRFCLEVTEGHIISRNPLVTQNLTHLSNAGMSIALDDFGTERSEIKTLIDFPMIDTIKLDLSVVQCPERAYATALTYIAQATERKVVAEGVETQEQADWLRDLGVEYGQGWLFGKPAHPLLFNKPILERGL